MADEKFEGKSWSNGMNAEHEKATIGPSISIKGEISGSDDLLILGSVEGTVDLKENIVTVGKSAKVKAHIYGKVIRIEGEVVGDLFGREQVVVHKSGFVRGNITAPRLTLEDGARLKGSIDTESTTTTSSDTSSSNDKFKALPAQNNGVKDTKGLSTPTTPVL